MISNHNSAVTSINVAYQRTIEIVAEKLEVNTPRSSRTKGLIGLFSKLYSR